MISSLPSSEGKSTKDLPCFILMAIWNSYEKRNSIFFIDKWWFPEIGLPPSHPFIARIFQYKSSSYWGLPMYGTPQIIILIIYGHYQRAKRQDPSAPATTSTTTSARARAGLWRILGREGDDSSCTSWQCLGIKPFDTGNWGALSGDGIEQICDELL